MQSDTILYRLKYNQKIMIYIMNNVSHEFAMCSCIWRYKCLAHETNETHNHSINCPTDDCVHIYDENNSMFRIERNIHIKIVEQQLSITIL